MMVAEQFFIRPGADILLLRCQTIGHMYGRYLDIVGKVTEDGGTTGELEAFEQVYVFNTAPILSTNLHS